MEDGYNSDYRKILPAGIMLILLGILFALGAYINTSINNVAAPDNISTTTNSSAIYLNSSAASNYTMVSPLSQPQNMPATLVVVYANHTDNQTNSIIVYVNGTEMGTMPNTGTTTTVTFPNVTTAQIGAGSWLNVSFNRTGDGRNVDYTILSAKLTYGMSNPNDVIYGNAIASISTMAGWLQIIAVVIAASAVIGTLIHKLFRRTEI